MPCSGACNVGQMSTTALVDSVLAAVDSVRAAHPA
jgi:uncharacterized metal-binding protein